MEPTGIEPVASCLQSGAGVPLPATQGVLVAGFCRRPDGRANTTSRLLESGWQYSHRGSAVHHL